MLFGIFLIIIGSCIYVNWPARQPSDRYFQRSTEDVNRSNGMRALAKAVLGAGLAFLVIGGVWQLLT